MSAFEMAIAFFIQMLIIVDPIVAMPVVLAITPHKNSADRRKIVLRSCFVGSLLSIFFIVAGPFFLKYFGIESAAVLIAGGILLFIIAIEMLYGRTTGTGTTPREERLAEELTDVSIFPLAFPVLAGPGVIATCLISAAKTASLSQRWPLILATLAVFFLAYVLLTRAELLMRMIGTLGISIASRIMGLLLVLLAAQYVINGVETILIAR